MNVTQLRAWKTDPRQPFNGVKKTLPGVPMAALQPPRTQPHPWRHGLHESVKYIKRVGAAANKLLHSGLKMRALASAGW
jgi:hypothetical protein